MTSRLKQIQPEGVIAQFGFPNNPLFLVNEAGLVTDEEGSVQGDKGLELFLVRDADQGLSESERRLAVGQLEHVDSATGEADLHFDLVTPGEASYRLSAGDIIGAIGAVAQRDKLTEINLTDTNLPAYMLEKVVGHAELAQGSAKPYEFEIAA